MPTDDEYFQQSGKIYQIKNIQQPSFTQAINWLSKISEKHTLHNTTNTMKYLNVTLTKQLKDMYDKYVKSLKKLIEDIGDGKISHAHRSIELT